MKKIIVLIMVLILTLTISGCDGDLQYTEPPQDDWPPTVKYAFCSKNGNYSKPYCTEFWTEYDLNEGKIIDGYYTQEEVAEMYNIQQGYIDDLELRIEELERFPNPNLCDYKYIFRVRIEEEISENIYIVAKEGYTVQGYYQIYTDQNISIGDIMQIMVYDDGSAKLYNEVICVGE